MADNTGLLASATKLRAITKSDSADVPLNYTRGLYVGTGGNVSLILKGDTDAVVVPNVADGSVLPLQVKRVMDTNTTADNFVGLY